MLVHSSNPPKKEDAGQVRRRASDGALARPSGSVLHSPHRISREHGFTNEAQLDSTRKNVSAALGSHRELSMWVTKQVMDREGRTLGYAKIGWNEETVQLVQNEEAVLRKLHTVRLSTAKAPRVIHGESGSGST